jgi:hypothetical protein
LRRHRLASEAGREQRPKYLNIHMYTFLLPLSRGPGRKRSSASMREERGAEILATRMLGIKLLARSPALSQSRRSAHRFAAQ